MPRGSHQGYCFRAETGHPVDANNWHIRVWAPTREKTGLRGLRIRGPRVHLASVLLGRRRCVKFVRHTLPHATPSTLFDWYAFVTKHEEDEAIPDFERWLVEEQAASHAV